MKSIRIQDLCKAFGSGKSKVAAVSNVSLEIGEREFFFLLGPSGCGKTTLLRMIAGLEEPTSGTIHLGDRDATHIPAERRNTAMVFQSYALWPHMTVARNVEFGPRMQGVGRAERRAIAADCLKRTQMEAYAKRKPNQLSGGQQQRVALARALAAKADCLLLDEPLSNLDAKLRLLMRGELRRLIKATGATAVYVTHDQKEALSMADRIAVMNEGALVQVGTPEDLYDRPASRFVAAFLGEANFLEGTIKRAGVRFAVETSAGTLAIEAAKPFPTDGAAVACCARPENVIIADADSPPPEGTAALPATVVSQTFLGEMRQYVCALKDGSEWRVSLMGETRARWQPGDAVSLHIPAADVRVLEP